MIRQLIQNPRLLGIGCTFVCMGLLLAGLWPLDFFPKNAVRWLPNQDGLDFYGNEISEAFCAGGAALSPNPLKSKNPNAPMKGAVSVEAWFEPSAEPAWAKARIVSFYDEGGNEAFFVGQWESALFVRKLIFKPEKGKRYKEIGIANVLPAGKTRFLTLTSGENGTAIYLEGKLVDIFPDIRLIGENESLIGRSIRVGNSSDAKSPWFGKLYGLAIYDHSLTPDQVPQGYHGWTRQLHLEPYFEDRAIARYAFAERSGAVASSIVGANNSLIIPQHLPFEKRVLESPGKTELLKFWFSKDMVANIMGFIPFGFLMAGWLQMGRRRDLGRSYAIVIGLGFLISLTIELLQVYMPVRSSSRVDLMCNTLGAVLGVSFFHALVLNRQGRRRGEKAVRV